MNDPAWIVIPALDCWPYTRDAIVDSLAQTVRPHVIVINNGSSDAMRTALEQWAEKEPRLHVFHFDPPFPSLSGTWKCGARLAFECGAPDVLIVNNDTRFAPKTYESLRAAMRNADALFVSAVGVTEDQYDPEDGAAGTVWDDTRGGPDYSCFLLSREGFEKYPFDEGYIPCYGEDVCNHREYLLGGDGHRIFSVNLPFLHIGGGSRTINQSKEARAKFEKQAAIGRRHYVRSWGGEPNFERFAVKGDPSSAQDGVTTPELQARESHLRPADHAERLQQEKHRDDDQDHVHDR